jgi:hypothetical protein
MSAKLFRLVSAAVLLAVLWALPLGGQTALAEEPEPYTLPLPPGMVEGIGTHFEVAESAYLNVSLDSSAVVYANISSVPNVVEVHVEAAAGDLAAQLTLGGLVPGLEYHLYSDSLENHIQFIASEAGAYTWEQGLVDPHVLFLQTVPSTYIISATTTGGHCGQIGIWNNLTKTCTLNQDVKDTIQINSSDITLDGAGHTLTGLPNKSAGVLVPGATNAATSRVTVKNLTIEGFHDGVSLVNAQNCTITGLTIRNVTRHGVNIWPTGSKYSTSSHKVTLNSITGGNAGIYVKNSNSSQFRGNLIDGLAAQNSTGINVDGLNNIFTGNRVLNTNTGIQNKSGNAFQRNTVRAAGAALDGPMGAFYNNNLHAYGLPFFNITSSQALWTGLPYGGSYWESFSGNGELCIDADLNGVCDAAFTPKDKDGDNAGYDALPWKAPNGWLKIQMNAPVAPVLLGTPITLGVSYADPDSVPQYTAWINWGDGTTSDPIVGLDSTDAFSLDHLYTETGVYEIKLTLFDDMYLATSTAVFRYVVIYDPSAGFVTGGGWFNSPAGAYVLKPELSGHATFGFISKFYRTRTGANELDGDTVFEFHTGNLRFESADYDWLVVNKTKAMFHGWGYINDDLSKQYTFSLTAIDEGDVGDRFRIQIWDAVSNQLIYDNNIGCSSNDLSSGTDILSGSIIVQTSSK